MLWLNWYNLIIYFLFWELFDLMSFNPLSYNIDETWLILFALKTSMSSSRQKELRLKLISDLFFKFIKILFIKDLISNGKLKFIYFLTWKEKLRKFLIFLKIILQIWSFWVIYDIVIFNKCKLFDQALLNLINY